MVSNDVDMLFSNIDRECNIIDAAAPKKRGAVDLVGLAEREDLIQVLKFEPMRSVSELQL